MRSETADGHRDQVNGHWLDMPSNAFELALIDRLELQPLGDTQRNNSAVRRRVNSCRYQISRPLFRRVTDGHRDEWRRRLEFGHITKCDHTSALFGTSRTSPERGIGCGWSVT